MKKGFVYILTNKPYGVLYTGVTSNLSQRITEHRSGKQKGFTEKYNCTHLVYCEVCDTIESAIIREKQIKRMSREDKVQMIGAINQHWQDLSYSVDI